MRRDIEISKVQEVKKDLPALASSIWELGNIISVGFSPRFYTEKSLFGKKREKASLSVSGDFNPSEVYSAICNAGYSITKIDKFEFN